MHYLNRWQGVDGATVMRLFQCIGNKRMDKLAPRTTKTAFHSLFFNEGLNTTQCFVGYALSLHCFLKLKRQKLTHTTSGPTQHEKAELFSNLAVLLSHRNSADVINFHSDPIVGNTEVCGKLGFFLSGEWNPFWKGVECTSNCSPTKTISRHRLLQEVSVW